MPRPSKKPRSHGVEPSPTPMMPTAGDSSTVTRRRSPNFELASSSAVIQPAVPPPTTTTCRMGGSGSSPAGRVRAATFSLNSVAEADMDSMQRRRRRS